MSKKEIDNKTTTTGTAPDTATMESTDLMIPAGGFAPAVARPASIDPNDRFGSEVDPDELRLPRLVIAQGLSPELQENNSNYMDGLKANDMFNNMTNEIYGREAMMFIPLRRDIRRIEFIPKAEGGGVRDMNVPKGDPRLQWTGTGADRKPPVATEFVEFPSLLLRPGKAPEPIVISFKCTNKWVRRSADQLTLFINTRNAPIYAGMYTIESKPQTNTKGTFGVAIPKNAGFVPKDTSAAGAKLYEFAESLSKSWEGKKLAVDETMMPGADDFDAAELERQSQEQKAKGQTDM